MNKITFRPSSRDDAADLCNWEMDNPSNSDQALLDGIYTCDLKTDTHISIFDDCGDIVGITIFNRKTGYVFYLYIREDLRRNGLGKQVLDFIQQSIEGDTIKVDPFTSDADSFFKACGFIDDTLQIKR
jgi:GNAT superfamily N-acetyltransferase